MRVKSLSSLHTFYSFFFFKSKHILRVTIRIFQLSVHIIACQTVSNYTEMPQENTLVSFQLTRCKLVEGNSRFVILKEHLRYNRLLLIVSEILITKL